MENQRLADYIKEVNKAHEYYFALTPYYAPVIDRPSAIDVRFDYERCVKRGDHIRKVAWDMHMHDASIQSYIYVKFFSKKERPFVEVVIPNRDSFENGAFMLQINNCSPDYSEQVVIDILQGIIEEFFAL